MSSFEPRPFDDIGEVVEIVEQTQRVDDRPTERIAAIRRREMRLSLGDPVDPQQVDAELGVRRPQIRLDSHGLEQQLDRLAVAPRDDVEVRRHGVDVAEARMLLQRCRGPLAIGHAAQQVGRGLQRIDLERRQILCVGNARCAG